MNRARLCIVLASLAVTASALEIDELSVWKEDRAYHIRMSFDVGAPVSSVVNVLTDFEHPERLNPDVNKREVIDRFEGVTRVRTELRSCLFLFCRNIEFTQDVSVDGGVIRADIVPEMSDFRSGTMRWSVTAAGDNMSHVVYTAEMEPGVFIPPLIGRALVSNMLEKEALGAALQLETETGSDSSSRQEGLFPE